MMASAKNDKGMNDKSASNASSQEIAAEEEEDENGLKGEQSKALQNMYGSDDIKEILQKKDLSAALDFIKSIAKDPKLQSAREIELEKVVVSKSDIESVALEMECTKAEAERALRENNGNLEKALLALIE